MSKKVRVVIEGGVADIYAEPGVEIEVIDLDTGLIEWHCVRCGEEFDAAQLRNLRSARPFKALACPVCGGPVNQF